MRVLPQILSTFAPILQKPSPEAVAEHLTSLGFETEILPGETPVLDVSITPNRADGMSHLGLARDLLAQHHRNRQHPAKVLTLPPEGLWERLPDLSSPTIVIKPASLAPQYHAILFDHVTIQSSPAWLQEELTLLGIRPINNVVDLTNYLMEVYGQPLHAFDADALLGDTLTVRAARAGERLETLDGTERTLPAGIAVIEDRAGLVDLAGILGGANSQVRSSTTRILLQAAIFDRTRIRQATNTLNLRTPAATRYERGVDPALSIPVLDWATKLLTAKEFGKAKARGRIAAATFEHLPDPIRVDPERVKSLLGMNVAASTQVQYLRSLGAEVDVTNTGYTVRPPSWRFDLEIWQDVAEEVARLIGLDDELPAKRLAPWTGALEPSEFEWAEGLKDRLVDLGLSEVQTYSFVSKQDLAQLALPSVGELANPLNPHLRFLRPSLAPGLAAVVASNSMFDPIQIFEIGHVFTQKSESVNLAIALAGNAGPTADWLVRLADAIGMDSGALKQLVTLQELDVAVRQSYKIRKSRVTLIEVPLAALAQARRIPANYRIPSVVQPYRALSKYPPVSRDIACLVDREVSPQDVLAFLGSLDPRIELVEWFDEFSSDALGEGKKSLGYHLFYSHPDRTLTDLEITELHGQVEDSLAAAFAAQIR
ncbi:phenylalanine--tRNA ligase subunit beta [Candidatus Berkelbacteria bacterium]|nr:phenylalanine--tRNA ligase subunit beta [Candidatus Berkelbacteria bacterium]